MRRSIKWVLCILVAVGVAFLLARQWHDLPRWSQVFLFVTAMWALMVTVMRLAVWPKSRRALRSILFCVPIWWSLPTIAILLWGLTTTVVYLAENEMTAATTKEEVHFFFQLVTGNWSNPPYITDQKLRKPFEMIPFRMAASISFAIMLNLAALGLFAWLLKRFRDLRMEVNAMAHTNLVLKTVSAQRDVIMGTNVVEAVSRITPQTDPQEIRNAVIGTMAKVDNELENEIFPEMYGPEKAEKIRAKLKELREVILG